MRTFNTNNIKFLRSTITGKEIIQPQTFFIGIENGFFSSGSDFKAAMDRARAGLIPLIWAARADRTVSAQEVDLLTDFIRDRFTLFRAGKEGNWNIRAARRWILEASPTLEVALGALARGAQNKGEKSLIDQYATRLITVNGGPDEKVRARLQKLNLV